MCSCSCCVACLCTHCGCEGHPQKAQPQRLDRRCCWLQTPHAATAHLCCSHITSPTFCRSVHCMCRQPQPQTATPSCGGASTLWIQHTALLRSWSRSSAATLSCGEARCGGWQPCHCTAWACAVCLITCRCFLAELVGHRIFWSPTPQANLQCPCHVCRAVCWQGSRAPRVCAADGLPAHLRTHRPGRSQRRRLPAVQAGPPAPHHRHAAASHWHRLWQFAG